MKDFALVLTERSCALKSHLRMLSTSLDPDLSPDDSISAEGRDFQNFFFY